MTGLWNMITEEELAAAEPLLYELGFCVGDPLTIMKIDGILHVKMSEGEWRSLGISGHLVQLELFSE